MFLGEVSVKRLLTRYDWLLIVSLSAVIVLSIGDFRQVPIAEEVLLVLLALSVLGVTASVHGLMHNYWQAAAFGTVVSTLPFLLGIVISPGKFGIILLLPGFLLFVLVVFAVSLLVGIPFIRSRRELS